VGENEGTSANHGCMCGRGGAYQNQSEVWGEELRRADDRCHKFKQEIAEL